MQFYAIASGKGNYDRTWQCFLKKTKTGKVERRRPGREKKITILFYNVIVICNRCPMLLYFNVL
jgi:hypothetical protein